MLDSSLPIFQDHDMISVCFRLLLFSGNNVKHPNASIQIFLQYLRFLPKFRKAKCLGCEISVFCLLSFCQNERFLRFPSLYNFEESVFIFQFLNDKMYNYVKHNITVNFIIQKLKNKHIFLKKYKS